MKLAITGVGGGVGQSILKSLAHTDYEVIGLDGESMGTGLYVTNSAFKIPYASNPDFIPALLKICSAEKVALLFPGLDAELMPLAEYREEFSNIGTTVVVSKPGVIEISDNKQHTYDVLTEAGVNVPFTQAAVDFMPADDKFPVIVKPRIGGARSRNVYVVRNRKEFDSLVVQLGEQLIHYIVMDYIEGDEYTCGTVTLDDSYIGSIIMRRILRDGDTYKCFVEKNDVIEETVRKVADTLKPVGACNIQLRVKDNIPYVFEINARCSGTTAARSLSGFNEPLMIADYLLKGLKPEFSVKEQTIFRYWKELVVDNEEVDQVLRNGERNNIGRIKDF